MIEPYTKEIEEQMQELYNRLLERNRRLYAGIEALKWPDGGVSYIARIFGCSRETIRRGRKELEFETTRAPSRERKVGAGRKPALTSWYWWGLIFLLKEHTAGDPMDEKVKWTHLTCGEMASLLSKEGIKVSRHLVRKGLKKHGYVKRKALKVC